MVKCHQLLRIAKEFSGGASRIYHRFFPHDITTRLGVSSLREDSDSKDRLNNNTRLKKRRPSVSTISETGSLIVEGTARLPPLADRQHRPVMDKLSRQVSIMKASGAGSKRGSGRKVSILDPKSLSEGPVEGIRNPALDESDETTEQPEDQVETETETPPAEEATQESETAEQNGTGSNTDQDGGTEGAENNKEGDKQEEPKEEGQQEEAQEDKSKSSDKKKYRQPQQDFKVCEADIPLVDIDAAEAQQQIQRKKGKRPFVIRRGGDDDEMKQVIPYMSLPLAIICCLLNIFLPGFGTLLSGFSLLCKWGVRDPNAGPNQKDEDLGHALYLNVVVALSQMITITFMLVGYFWSVAWGAQMVRMAIELRRWKKGQPQFKGQVMPEDDEESAPKTQSSTKARQSSQGAAAAIP
ncbi:hypothetical protein Bbelb_356110 [Branchiostoma belcheri]|nr:hypothetical protein Bbelb_356110 [Branchiostoma belcheri]